MQAEIAGYVYVAHHPETGLYKIGRSKDPKRRMYNIVPTGEIVHLHLVIPAKRSKWLEAYFHKAFAHKSAGGEWFRLDDADIALLESIPFVASRNDLPTQINCLARKSRGFTKSSPPKRLHCSLNAFRLSISAEIEEALACYADSLKFRPRKSAIALTAIQKFLEREGFYPPKKSPDA